MVKFKLVKTEDYNRLKAEQETNKLKIEELKEKIESLENPESCSVGYWCEACISGRAFHGMFDTEYGCLKKVIHKCKEFEEKKIGER